MVEVANAAEQQMQEPVGSGMDKTLNDRAGQDLHVSTHEENKTNVIDSDNWIEVRLQGKLPERRSNHCAFILTLRGEEYLYVHGGRDLKEGSIETMWRLHLSGIHALEQEDGSNGLVEWELIPTSGSGPGKISHHTVSVRESKEVIFYGGLKGDDSVQEVYLFNPNTNSWSRVNSSNASEEVLARDDHVMSDVSDGSFLVFGGFVNGSRTNDLALFSMQNSHTINSNHVQATTANEMPVPRASHSSAFYNGKMYIFGGQDDDNNKLDDIWEFDNSTSVWKQIEIAEGAFKPAARSGHSAVVYGDMMYIFGGILELTKELNDMLIFDFKRMCFVQGEERPDFKEGSPERRAGTMQQDTYGESSPTRTNKGGSPTRRKTIGASPTLRSPMKSRRISSPEKNVRTGDARREGLGTPTSVTMMNTFIIKNADHSFDQYHQSMKKRKIFGGMDHNATQNNDNQFGLIRGCKPTARDGHITIVDSKGFMYVFGGDRHLMPFNDLYMIKLQ